MNRLAALLASALISGAIAPAHGGLFGSTDSDTEANTNARLEPHGAAVDVRKYLAPCAASADVDTCVTRAANDARLAGLTLHFPSGTYVLSAWEPPCPLTIAGDGEGKTILQRPANSAQAIVSSANCGGLRISNLTIDGNRANNLRIGYSVILTGDWNFNLDNVEVKGSKGAGSALTIQDSKDDLNNSQSTLSALYLHDNDGNGLYIKKHAWNWTLKDSVIRDNGGVGVTVIDYEFPPAEAQFANCAILANDISHNAGMGVSLTSGISGGTASKQSNGPFKTVKNCKILDNQVNHNGHYGIFMAGGYNIEIGSNTATYNGDGTGSVVAGINSALCEACNVHDNTSKYNAFYGIDAGGAVDTKITNNVIIGNGNSVIGNGNGINCGACQGVEISDNLIDSNGSTEGGLQIHVTTYDGGVSGFSISAKNISIRSNRLICANANQIGLLVLSDPPGMVVESNYAEGCAIFKGYVLHITQGLVLGNRQSNWPNGFSVTSSGSDVVFPDAADNVAVDLTDGREITEVWPHFYFANYQKVYAVVVTKRGSNYSSSPTVTFSGGGCALEPKGLAFQDNLGHVVGVILSSFGSSCSSAPMVAIGDKSGTGATAIAYVLSSLPNMGRPITVIWRAGLTVKQNPQSLDLLGGAGFTVPSGVAYSSKLRVENNHWVEVSREILKR